VRSKICIREVWTECLKRDNADLTPAKRTQIAKAIRQMKGWSSRTRAARFGVRFGTQKAYFRKMSNQI